MKEPNLIAAFLYRVAGADPNILKNCEIKEQILFLTIGALLLLTATWAMIAAQGLLLYIFAIEGSETARWFVGIFYATFIFNVDRLFVVTTDDRAGVWTKTFKTFIRLGVSIAISSVISELTILTIYKQEITATIPQISQERAQVFQEQISKNKEDIAHLDITIDSLYKVTQKSDEMIALEKKIEKAAEAEGRAQANVDMAKKLCNMRGAKDPACDRISGYEGQLNAAKSSKQMYEEQLKEEKSRVYKGVEGKISDLKSKKEAINKDTDRQKAKIKYTEDSFKGLMASQMAFQKLKEISSAGRWAGPVVIFYWLLTFLFILLETAPVIVKAFFVNTEGYNQLLQNQRRALKINRLGLVGLWQHKTLILDFRPNGDLWIDSDRSRKWSYNDKEKRLSLSNSNGRTELDGTIIDQQPDYLLLRDNQTQEVIILTRIS